MADYGISTLGITLSYGVETTAGTKPATFKTLTRINSIGGITAEPEVIDASALEDAVTHNIKGRTTISDTVAITVNLTSETLAEWTDSANGVIKKFNDLTGGKRMWFQVSYDGKLSKSSTAQSYFFVAQPPSTFPMPESNQNELQTVEIPLVVVSAEGYADAVTPS